MQRRTRVRARLRVQHGAKRPRSADVHVGSSREQCQSRKKTYANTAQSLDFGAACGAVEFVCGHSVHTLDYGSPQDHTSPRNSKLKKSSHTRSHKKTRSHSTAGSTSYTVTQIQDPISTIYSTQLLPNSCESRAMPCPLRTRDTKEIEPNRTGFGKVSMY